MKRLLISVFAAAALVSCFDFVGANEEFCRNHFDGDPTCGDGGAGADAGPPEDGGDGEADSGLDTGMDAGGSDPYELFIEALTTRTCEIAIACGHFDPDAGDCSVWFGQQYRHFRSRSAFVAQNVPACLEALDLYEARCNASLGIGSLACGLVFQSRTEPGAPCDGDCGFFPGMTCLPADPAATNDCDSICSQRDYCPAVDGGRCARDEYCATNGCQKLPVMGMPCHQGARCHPDLQCTGGTCQARLQANDPCVYQFQCALGLACRYDLPDGGATCQPKKDEGESCGAPGDCKAGLTCLENRTCGFARVVDAGADCGAGLTCKQGYCKLDDGSGYTSGGPGAGTCAPPAPGELCQLPGSCGWGRTCAPDGGGCVVSTLNSACEDHRGCPNEMRCDMVARKCVPRGSMDAPCNASDGDEACLAPLHCANGSCQPRPRVGQPCGPGYTCVAPADCIGGQCVLTGFVGSPCRASPTGGPGSCAEGACDGSDGGRGTCVAPRADGQPCVVASECASQYCDRQTRTCRAGTCP